MFQNEYTFGRYRATGKEDEFHANYERAVEEVGRIFGKTYPMIVGGKEVYTSEGTIDDTSPSNTELVLRKLQNGTTQHADSAKAAAS